MFTTVDIPNFPKPTDEEFARLWQEHCDRWMPKRQSVCAAPQAVQPKPFLVQTASTRFALELGRFALHVSVAALILRFCLSWWCRADTSR